MFVVSKNLHRRQLSESQRAMVASKIATLKEGRPNKTTEISGVSQAQAAQMLNVGERSVKRAREVITQGSPEVVQAVESGKVGKLIRVLLFINPVNKCFEVTLPVKHSAVNAKTLQVVFFRLVEKKRPSNADSFGSFFDSVCYAFDGFVHCDLPCKSTSALYLL